MKKSQDERFNTLNNSIITQNDEFDKVKAKCDGKKENIRNNVSSTRANTYMQMQFPQPGVPMNMFNSMNQWRKHVDKFTRQDHPKKSVGTEVEIPYNSTEAGR